VAYAADAVAVEQNGIHFAITFNFAASLTYERHEPTAKDLRAATYVVAAAEQVRRLRKSIADERHGFRIVGVISEV
jgi:hypothetical protein